MINDLKIGKDDLTVDTLMPCSAVTAVTKAPIYKFMWNIKAKETNITKM